MHQIFYFSDIRSLYKDLLTLYRSNRLITDGELRKKVSCETIIVMVWNII